MGDVLGLIRENARRSPDHVAVKDSETSLTYGELIDTVGEVAAAMNSRGVVPGDRVVLLLANTIEYVVGALSCLWIGAIFVPLDAADPVTRLSSLIGDCRPALVVTNGAADETALAQLGLMPPFVSVSQLRAEHAPAVSVASEDERPAYMIYTSGTTGKPKGVVIGSGAFVSAVMACATARGLDSRTRTLSVSPFHFDGSFATLFTTLVSGGTLILRSRDSLLFARVFFNTIISESVTYTGFTPSYFRLLASNPQFEMLAGTNLDVIAMGGETLSVADVQRVWEVAPHVRIFNGYGPTETTVTASQKELRQSTFASDEISIGRPNPHVQFHLVDAEGHLIEESGVVGELYIGGRQIMDGYWASPELTGQVIRTDVIGGERLYKTGDLVFRDPQGDYVYVSRVDRVVKRSGVRISLAEITDTFCNDARVSTATSVAFDDAGALGIVTFVVASAAVATDDLLRHARDFLSPTMLPNEVRIVDSMPLTSSGKVDERRLLKDADLAQWSSTPSP